MRELIPLEARLASWAIAAFFFTFALVKGPHEPQSTMVLSPCAAVEAASALLAGIGLLYALFTPWRHLAPAVGSFGMESEPTTLSPTNTHETRTIAMTFAFVALLLFRMCTPKDLSKAGVHMNACETEDGAWAFRAASGFCMILCVQIASCRSAAHDKPIDVERPGCIGLMMWCEPGEAILPILVLVVSLLFFVAAI